MARLPLPLLLVTVALHLLLPLLLVDDVSGQVISVQPVLNPTSSSSGQSQHSHQATLNGQAPFAPQVTGRCERAQMLITVKGTGVALVHARAFRTREACRAVSPTNGTGSHQQVLQLTIDLLAVEDTKNPSLNSRFCGAVALSESEKAVSLAVRSHATLELSSDQYFLLTCDGLPATPPARGRESRLLRDQDDGLRVVNRIRSTETEDDVIVTGHRSVLQLGQSYSLVTSNANSQSNSQNSRFVIGSCEAFGRRAAKDLVRLTDARACSLDSSLVESSSSGRVDILSAFRFLDERDRDDGQHDLQDQIVTFQCKRAPCASSAGGCPAPCSDESSALLARAGQLVSVTVAVSRHADADGGDCIAAELRAQWLLALLICIGILLLVMFLLNLFLCSSLSCTCVRSTRASSTAADDEDFDRDDVSGHHHRDYYVADYGLNQQQQKQFDGIDHQSQLNQNNNNHSDYDPYGHGIGGHHQSELGGGGGRARTTTPHSRY